MLTEKEWKRVAPYLVEFESAGARSVADALTDKDRELAKAIIAAKRHLGPLGMIEVGIVLGRMIADLDNPAIRN